MSASIDERVVELRFDSKGFESGVSKTMSALGKLKKTLKLEGATSGLDAIQSKASKGLSLGRIGDAVGQVSNKFKLLSVAGVAALATIVSKATSAGLAVAKSFTIQPIMDGFSEYETKIGSIQTILANTQRFGTKLPEVNRNLNELNKYADKTIYNFGDMTKNIGLFTNAGIRVGDATSMIKGFSNAAAASGTSAQGASSAAYQLSQALSAGKITLMDWRSLQNVGMGNKNMQLGIVKIADAMGTMKKAGTSASEVTKNFNGSLEKGWLKADVMSNYLKIMAGDMSDTQMKALGLDAATIKMFKGQQKTAEDAATKVRTFSQLMGTLKEAVGSGWGQSFETVLGGFNDATKLFTGISNSLGNVINDSANARNKILKGWVKFGGRNAAIEGFKNMFKNLIAVIKPVKDAFREIFPRTTGKQLAGYSKAFRDIMKDMKPSAETIDKLKRTFKGLFAALDIGFIIIKKVFQVIVDLFTQASESTSGILSFTAGIGDFIVKLRDAIKNGRGLSKVFRVITKVLTFPIKAIQLLGSFLTGLFSSFSSGGKTVDRFGKRMSALSRIGDAIKSAWDGIADRFGAVGKIFAPVLQKFAEFFSALPSKIAGWLSSGNYNDALDTLNTGLFAVLVLAIKKFLKGGLSFKGDIGGGLLDTIKESFEGLTGTMKNMQAQLKANTLMKLAVAIGLLVASVVALSLIDSDKLTKAMAALGVAFSELLGAMLIMEKITKGGSIAKMPLLAASMILLALAVDILVLAVAGLAQLDWEQLAKGLGGVLVLIAAMAGASKVLSKNSKGMISAGAGLILLAGGIAILAHSVKLLGDLDWEQLAKGLGGVAALLVSLALFTKFSKAGKGAAAQGLGIALLAGAIYILQKAVENFAKMSWEQIGKGLAGVAGGLIAIALALKMIPAKSVISAAAVLMVAASLKMIGEAIGTMGSYSWETIAKGIASLAGALILIAAALKLLPPSSLLSAAAIFVVAASLGMIADALGQMGGMTWEEIAKGLITLAGSLAIIAGAMYLMTAALPGAAATLIVAVALRALAPVLQMFAKMSWEELIKGLAGLAGVFVILGVAGIALAPVTPILLLLSAAILGMGAGMLMAATACLVMITVIKQVIPIFVAIGGAIAGAVKWAVGILPGLWSTIKTVFGKIVSFLKGLGPKIGSLAKTIVMGIWNAITKLAPKIFSAALSMATGIFNAVKRIAPKVISAAASMMSSFLGKITGFIGRVLSAGRSIASNVLNGVRSKISQMRTAAITAMSNFVNGIKSKVSAAGGAAKSAANNVINKIKSALRGAVSAVSSAAGAIGRAIINGIKNAMTGLAGGLLSKAKSIGDKVVGFMKKPFGIGGPSKVMCEMGETIMTSLGSGMDGSAFVANKSAESAGKDMLKTMRKSLSGLSSIIDDDSIRSPVIRPMLDLSGVKKDASTIDSIFKSNMTSVSTGKSLADTIVTQRKTPTGSELSTDMSTLAAQQRAERARPITFNQFNNSPRALSSADIYRQTKNQLSTMKGALRS